MVFGDTVAMAMMAARKLTKEEYAANHPAGRIGKSLIFKVLDLTEIGDFYIVLYLILVFCFFNFGNVGGLDLVDSRIGVPFFSDSNDL